MEGVVQKKPSKKIWIIISIVILVILILAVVIGLRIRGGDGIKELKINSLKSMKCLASCPYVERLDAFGKSRTLLVGECMNACENHYEPFGGIDIEDEEEIKKYEELLAFNLNFSDCFSLMSIQEQDFKDCMNNRIESYSYIVDLSDFKADIEYEVVDIKIEEAICSEESAEVNVRLNMGSNIEGINFHLREGGHSIFIQKTSVPLSGELKEYKIFYSENMAIANGDTTISPEGVAISVTVNGIMTDIKDYSSC